MQLTEQQRQRLQDEKPAIADSTDANAQTPIRANQGTQWLALLTDVGEFQVGD
jgi:cleavage and polyadenylation specificity factor subunit 1